MRAILIREPGDETVLVLGEAPRARARPGRRAHPRPRHGA